MTPEEIHAVEEFAQHHLPEGRLTGTVWTSEVATTGCDLPTLLRLIREYHSLPAHERKFTFLVTPTNIVVARETAQRMR